MGKVSFFRFLEEIRRVVVVLVDCGQWVDRVGETF